MNIVEFHEVSKVYFHGGGRMLLRNRIQDWISGKRPESFFSKDSAQDHPVASRLFAVAGVQGIMLLGDFITVSKMPDGNWAEITTGVKKVLASI